LLDKESKNIKLDKIYFSFNEKIINVIIKNITYKSKLICYKNIINDSVELILHTNIILKA
jgi:hypothetical protein